MTALLTALFPSKATVSVSSDTVMTTPQMGEMSTHMDMTMRAESVAAPAPKPAPAPAP